MYFGGDGYCDVNFFWFRWFEVIEVGFDYFRFRICDGVGFFYGCYGRIDM